MRTSDYKNLNVWNKSIDFVMDIYEFVQQLPAQERYGLADQLRRAVVSIPSNIAEGQSRNSDKDFIRFLNIANGSVAEVETQLIICYKLKYIDNNKFEGLSGKVNLLGAMLRSLINSIENRNVF